MSGRDFFVIPVVVGSLDWVSFSGSSGITSNPWKVTLRFVGIGVLLCRGVPSLIVGVREMSSFIRVRISSGLVSGELPGPWVESSIWVSWGSIVQSCILFANSAILADMMLSSLALIGSSSDNIFCNSVSTSSPSEKCDGTSYETSYG